MGLQWTVIESRLSSGGYQSTGPRSVVANQQITFSILASDDLGNPIPASAVTEEQALEAPGLPEVNRDTFAWQDFFGGSAWFINPWLICIAKRAERDAQNGLIFRVACDYSTYTRWQVKEEDLRLIPAVNTIDQLPYLLERAWTGETRIIYEPATADVPPVPLRLPTGSLYSQPFRRKFPKQVRRVSQFEDIMDNDLDSTIEGRLYGINSTSYAGDPVSDPTLPPRWIIDNIDYQKVRVRVDNNNFLEPYMMTYKVDREAKDGGQFDRRALVDNYILTNPPDLNTKVSYRDPTNQQAVVDVLLTTDGGKKDPQTGDPDYQNYSVQPEISFAFLKA